MAQVTVSCADDSEHEITLDVDAEEIAALRGADPNAFMSNILCPTCSTAHKVKMGAILIVAADGGGSIGDADRESYVRTTIEE